MEALGINTGYLIMQIVGMTMLLFILWVFIAGLSKRNSLKRATPITTAFVEEGAVHLPPELVLGVTKFDVYKEKNKLILVPKSELK